MNASTERWICPHCGAEIPPSRQSESDCVCCSSPVRVGPYVLLEEIERGPEGAFFRAREPGSSPVKVLRFFPEGFSASSTGLLALVKSASQMAHPHLALVGDSGEYRGRTYVVYAKPPGIPVSKADLALRETVAVIRDAALALDSAHGRGFVHWSLRPDSLRVTRIEGGMSEDARWHVTVTDSGLVLPRELREPAFMSPEESTGAKIDARSNVYSLGAILYSFAAGRPPGSPLESPSRFNPLVGSELESLILQAMERDPARRTPGAGRLAAALTQWLGDGAPPPRRSPEPPKKAEVPIRRPLPSPKILIGAGVAAGAFLLLLAVLLWPRGKSEGAPRVEEKKAALAEPAPAVRPRGPRTLLRAVTRPAGATLEIDGRTRVWQTPCELTERELGAGEHEITLALPGYRSHRQKITLAAEGEPFLLERTLTAETPPPVVAKVEPPPPPPPTPAPVIQKPDPPPPPPPPPPPKVEPVVEAPRPARLAVQVATGMQVHLLPIPPGLRNGDLMVLLWSENTDAVLRALDGLEAKDLPFVRDRVKALAGRTEPEIRRRAGSRIPSSAAAEQAAPLQSRAADREGRAAFEGLPPGRTYRVLATAAGRKDFVSEELKPGAGADLAVRAEPEPPPPPPPVAPPAGRLGEVQFVHPELGIFVKLDAPGVLAAGDTLEILRNGKPAAEVRVDKLTAPETVYPHGCAVCQPLKGTAAKGDSVRKAGK